MSTIAVNAITDASGGNAASINGATPTTDNTMGRNRIINGDMRIDARNAGASVTPTDGQYTLDRWRCLQAVSSKYSAQQSSVAPSGFSNSFLATSLSAYSVGSSEYFVVEQKVEGFNFADFAWGTASAATVTLSFWVRSSLTGTFGGAFRNSAANRSYPFTYTISAANTWEQKTVTVAGDTTGTWVGATNGVGVEIKFGLGVGSTLSGTAGAWAGANYLSATGATSIVGTNGATFYITGVQLEAGSVATSFERRMYGQELALCQRYYSTEPQFSFIGYSTTTNAVESRVSLKASMRAAPTISVANNGTLNFSSLTTRYITTEGFSIYIVPSSSGMAGLGNGGAYSNWTASAEL